MADAAGGGAAPSLKDAANRLRDTSKWLIGVFAAVGGVLIAGTQLASIGSLIPGDWLRFAIAVVGLLVAISGAAWVIAAALNVATAGSVSLTGLASRPSNDSVRTRLEGDQALMGTYGDLGALDRRYTDALRKRREAYEAYQIDDADADKLAASQRAHDDLEFVGQTVGNVLDVASFEDVANTFKHARGSLLGGALLAALGVAVFVAAANPPKANHEFSSPSIDATVNEGLTSLKASFVADSLDSDKRLQILVKVQPGSSTLYEVSSGPDSAGDVKRTIQLPLAAVRGDRIVLEAWRSDAARPQCDLDAPSGENGTSACAVVRVPAALARPRLIAAWESTTLVVSVTSLGLPADRSVGLRIVAASPTKRLRVYGANLGPNLGKVDETVKVSVPNGFESVCVEAKTVPSGSTTFSRALATRRRWGACPQWRVADRAWVRLAAPR
jgi:hypothetical protein